MKKRNVFLQGLPAVLLAMGLVFVGCGDNGDPSSPSGGNDIAVTFSSVSANGSATQTTTQLTLTFSQAIAGLSANNITLSGVPGVVKGILGGSGTTYTLPISGFSSGGTLSVAIAKSGYAISGSPKTTNVYFYSGGSGGDDIAVTLSSVTANGSTTQTTTQLTLTFSQAIVGLSANDITLSGASGVVKGTLGGSGSTYTLPISGFSSGGTLSVAVTKSGYAISGSPITVPIYFYSGGGPGDTAVTFSSVTANGSSSQTTTELTLTFSQAITDLTADDITLSGVSGVVKGTLSGSGPSYTLPISGFSSGGTLSVAVAKSGYAVSGSSKTVTIYYSIGSGGGNPNLVAKWYTSQYNADSDYGDAIMEFTPDGRLVRVYDMAEYTYSSTDTIITFEYSWGSVTASYVINGSKLTISDASGFIPISEGDYYKSIAVTLNNITADGSATQTTTQLTLTFSHAIAGLSTIDITLSGVPDVIRGTLSGTGPTYTLPIIGFKSGGTLSVEVSKSGYTVSGTPQTVEIYYYTNAGLVAEWYNSQEDADDIYYYITVYQFTADGYFINSFSQSYYYTATNDTITLVSLYGDVIETANYSINGTKLTLSNGTGSNLVAGDYFKRPEPIVFYPVTANGSSTQTTTQLTLTFDTAISGLTANDITLSGVSGVVKGTLSGSGPTYTLPISGFSAGGTLSVAVEKPGYIITNVSSRTVSIFYVDEATFTGLTANGSSSQATTQLTLTFSQAITGLSASDITLSGVSGVNKGTLSGSGPTYTLPISGFSVGGTLSVAVAKSGYAISGSPKTVTIYYSDTAVTLNSVTANGSSTQTTTQLTLTFDQAITDLTAADITLSGMSVSKGTLSGSGPTYTLGISGVSASGTLNVAVAKSGYAISGSPKTVSVYYYYVAPQPNTNPPGTPTLGATRSGNNITMTWSFPTGSSYGSPTSITVRLYDPDYEVWVDETTLAGTATSYTFNYTMWNDTSTLSTGAVKMGIVGENSYGTGSRAGTFNIATGVFY